VLDLDIKGFFDTLDHELLLKAVRRHADCAWVALYIERWLKAPAMLDSGDLVARTRGTPQGGVISPLLANLFLHYAFDLWMGREAPGVRFERYADDIICHCRSEREARMLWERIERRFADCGLALHPQKTKLVYCKDTNRKGEHAQVCFNFLGYRFQPRLAKWPNGKFGVSFLPAASPEGLAAIRREVRRWGLQRRSDKELHDLARMFNPYIRGWIGYYSCFYKSAMYPTLRLIDEHLLRWAARKCKRFRQRPRAARAWLGRVVEAEPRLFAHWTLLYGNGRMLGAV
jgi:group II intron reverse transcriptase/maturase